MRLIARVRGRVAAEKDRVVLECAWCGLTSVRRVAEGAEPSEERRSDCPVSPEGEHLWRER